jgi:hypothetical protein
MQKLTLVAALVTVLIGCGGNAVDLGVSGGKRLAELDQEESCAMANGAQEWFDDYQANFCIVQGQASGMIGQVGGLDFTAACEAARDECLADQDPPEPIDCAEVENNIPETCDATIRDAERCMTDALDLFDEVVRVGCDEPIDDETLASVQQRQADLPESCTVIFDECQLAGG